MSFLRVGSDYEPCARCGYDHEYDPEEAHEAHRSCQLCLIELATVGYGNGDDHNCGDHQLPYTGGRMALKESKRKTAPTDEVLEARRTWGGRLLIELNSIRKTPEWLGEQVGYKVPGSMHQVINGHQGISIEVYNKILEAVPEMRDVEPPPMKKDYQGAGAPGPHKDHEYPKLGSIESRRPK